MSADATLRSQPIAAVDARLTRMFGAPRRRTSDPIAELVTTILSQATTDAQTARSFDALRRRFPTWEQVRDARSSEIATIIHGSGLSRQKAPRIKRALQHITRERGRIELDFLKRLSVTEAREWLMQMEGVGRKTASIVLLFAFNRAVFPVDTHVHRVTTRLGWIPAKASAEKAHDLLEPLIPPKMHYRLHVNLIQLGREICQARTPRCAICPLTDLCAYYQSVTPTRKTE
ncbi:MAG: endonuclease III [Chloroflexota bacterium]